MKKFVYAALICFFCMQLALAQSNVQISGTITDPHAETVVITYQPHPLAAEPVLHEAKLDESGQFSLSFNLEKAMPVTFRHGREQSAMYLYPGDQISVSLTPEQFDETITYKGEGPGVAASNCLAAYFLEFEDGPRRQERYQKLKEESAVGYKAYEQKLHASHLLFLKQFHQREALEADFVQWMSWRSEYGMASSLLRFPSIHAYYQKLETHEVELPDAYTDFLKKISLQNDKALHLSEYLAFLNDYVAFTFEQDLEGAETPEDHKQQKFDLAAKLLKDEPLHLLRARMLMSALEYGNPMDVAAAYESFVDTEAGAAYEAYISPLYEKAMELAPGQEAPGFTLMNVEGKEVSLADFRGKVVYLDFWASWCGPCRREAPFAKELKERFKDEEVVFVYLSIDDDEAAWREAVDEEALGGVQLWSKGFRSETPQAYNVNGIPSYWLIHRDGTIANPFPDRPSGKRVDEQIRAALALSEDRASADK